jgi:RNA polymerase sigma-70 factor (ECF subfamily)
MLSAQPVGAMDRDLVVRAQHGDREAFAGLVHANLARMNALARLILHDAALAEDAVQDALVDAWQDLRGLRHPDRFEAWLRRILVNACNTNARRRSVRRVREIPVNPSLGATETDIQRSVAARDELEAGLRRLTVQQRTLLVLVYYADLSIADAAEAMGIPVGTAKSRLHRSIDALRAELAAVDREVARPREGFA